MGCGRSKPTAVSPAPTRATTGGIGLVTQSDREKDYRRFSDTSNNNQTLVKELENKLTEEEKQRKNLETQVRTLEEKLNLYSEKVKQAEPSNLNLKTKALPDVENTVLESDRERKELEKKIKVLEEKLDNYIERAAKNRGNNGTDILEGKADDIKTSIDSNDTEGSQVLEKHINYETDRDVMDGTNDKSSNTSTILGDDGKESEKIDDDKRDIFETETKVLQNEVDKNNSSTDNTSRLDPRPPVLSKDDLILDVKQFAEVDQHARNAPDKLRSSMPDLVRYLCKTSTDPLFHVRAFFVWTANNVKYDAAGFFGRSEKSPCDFRSVMETGLSVCEGYANVMEAMCKEAGIEVRKISGFAKGYGMSAEQQITTRHQTNHAWNAVFIRGSWFLLDSTWGAGHLDKSRQYKAKFNEFYFLSNPRHFVSSHFPYMNGDMVESMKWQLLEDPLSLERFNTLMRIRPEAFEIGVFPKSHLQSVINFEDELELTFKQEKELDNIFSTRLYKREGNMLSEVQFSTYMVINHGQLNIKAKPPETGDYKLEIFGRKQTANATDSSPQLFEYVLHCEVPANKSDMRIFPYPSAYPQAIIDECHVLEPLGKQIPPKTEIKMRFRSPHLKRMMIYQMMLKKDGDIFEGTVTTPEKHYLIDVYGSRSDSGTLSGQYQFCVG